MDPNDRAVYLAGEMGDDYDFWDYSPGYSPGEQSDDPDHSAAEEAAEADYELEMESWARRCTCTRAHGAVMSRYVGFVALARAALRTGEQPMPQTPTPAPTPAPAPQTPPTKRRRQQ